MGDFEIKKSKVLEAIYTGGDFRLSNDGNSLFSTCGGVVKVLDVADGQERFVIGNPEDEPRVTSFTVFNNDSSAIVAYTNDLVKNFRLQGSTATLMHQFRSLHNGPITSLLVTPDGETLLTGSPDFSVRVWQLSKRLCIHTLKGRCVVTSMCLIGANLLIVGYVEGQIRFYNLAKQTPTTPYELTVHTTRISSIVQSGKDANLVYVFSCDETMSIIDVGKKTVNKTVQTLEAVEVAVYVRSLNQVVSVGESGQLKFWDPENGRCILQKQFKSGRLDGLVYNEKSNTLVFSTFENNLLFVDAQSRNLSRCLAGNNDEILDVAFVSHELNCIAVATNSSKLKLYDLSTFSCSIFEGHTDNVMAVDSAKWESNLIASCSKDNSCILWRLEAQVDGAPKAKQVAIATGHTSSVTGIRFCQFRHEPFVLSVSNDTTVKMWDLRPLFKEANQEVDEPIKIGACSTFVAHTKDVTCVEVSSNDKLCVTGSMDKTAKLWHIDRSTMQLGPAGTLSGHRRGVWSAKFSNVSQIEFINNATQLLSVDSNGLLKAWDVKSGVCEKTVECHEDKIWSIRSILPSELALKEMKRRRRAIQERNKSEEKSQQFAMRPEEHVRFITAGSDGRIVLWEDVTEEYAAEQARIAAERMAQIQTLENYIRLEKFEDALALTLTLDHPHQSCSISPARFRNTRQFKAKIAPVRAQKTPSMMALDHFDFYYGPIFDKQWPSIRLGLLTPHKVTGLEHIGQELDTIDDILYYPRQLQLFCYQRDDLSDFPAPIKDENGISSWWLLDGSSVVPVLALDIQEDDVVLDMCAAPGGKRCLVCNDNKLSRLGQLRRALSMYIPITSEYNEKIVLKRKDASLLEAWDEEQVYDRDEQNIFAINTTQDRVNLPQLQTKLLINAIRAVKVGGTVVYSTCALSPQQNECVVENAAALVREHYDMDVVEVSVKRLENHLRNTGLYRFTDKCRRGMLIVPNIRSNFGPMFICKLKRTK
ncbi:Utp13 specific WD40 associated domain protein [Aphelenchoides besseyi]|nr:Utp13 specific WD40 associated domain protein [Aphelenchoides besseyi]